MKLHAFLEGDFKFSWCVWGLFRVRGHIVNTVRGLCPWIFQNATLIAEKHKKTLNKETKI